MPQTHIGPPLPNTFLYTNTKKISELLYHRLVLPKHPPICFFSQTVLILLLFVFWIHFRCRLGSEVKGGRMTGFREGRRTSLFPAFVACFCWCVQLLWPPPFWQAPRPTIGRTLTPQVKDFELCRKVAALTFPLSLCVFALQPDLAM